MTVSDPVPARSAAALVLVRDRSSGGLEVFMVRRHIRSEFVPDAYVFPGGTLKPADIEIERSGCCAPADGGPTALGTGFRAAALRECFEEAGVLLARRGETPLAVLSSDAARFASYRDGLNARVLTLEEVAALEGLTLSTDRLLHWAHWITPEAFPIRFDTHFFLAEMPQAQEAAHDQLETTAGVWISPEDALARFERGDFPIVFATIHQLRDLTGLAGTDALERFRDRTPRTIRPQVTQRDGADVIVVPENGD